MLTSCHSWYGKGRESRPMCIRQADGAGQKCAGADDRAGRRTRKQARPWWPDEVIEDTPNLDGLDFVQRADVSQLLSSAGRGMF